VRARLLVAGPIAVVASLVMAAGASAAGKAAVVTTTSDGAALTPPNCSLRDAITAVTNDADAGGCVITSPGGDDKITFDPALSGQTITLNGTEIVINDLLDDLNITGPGMNQLTVSGNDLSRVFNVQTPTTISGVSLVHGMAPAGATSQGAAINSTASGPFSLVLTDVKVADSAANATAATGDAFADGAGIHATGLIRLNQSVVTGNSATANQTGILANGAEARGGAIFSEGGIEITDSTISGNHATATTTGTTQAAAIAGIRTDDTLGMSGSTMSGNVASATATGTGSSANARGALYVVGGTTSGVEQSTIAGNKADATGDAGTPVQAGGVDLGTDTVIRSSTIALNGPDTATNVDGVNLYIEGGVNEILNTIVADPRGGGLNCAGGTLTSDGFNDDFSPAGASCLTSPLATDLISDPLLATGGLGNNGGLTRTIALQLTSPMIDKGSNASLTNPNQDQRGASYLRPVDFSGLPNADNGTDIGAFEVEKSCASQAKPGDTCSSGGGGGGGGGNPPVPGPTGPTGQRAAALKKCKKLKGKTKAKKRKKCTKHAKRLPV
jgi:hypothetical protein